MKLKILHINSYYSSSPFYKNLFEEQRKGNLHINVYVPVSKNFQRPDFDFGEYTTVSRCYFNFARLFFHLKHQMVYNDIIQKINIKNFEIIHAHSLFSNGYIAWKIKQKYNIPYIVAVRNTDLNIFFKRMIHLRKLGVKILKEAEKIIFISEPYKESVLQNYISNSEKNEIERKSVVLPNGIDNFWFENKGKEKSIKVDGKINLLYVGVVNKNKNLETTVDAIKILRKKGLDVKFTVVGDVKEQRIFEKLKNNDFIRFLPKTNKQNLLHIYSTNHIFIMPSINETFGLVYAEAMTQGLPVIYTRNQGFDRQFIDGKIGYAVDCFDRVEIANKIENILERYQDISQECLKQTTRYSWNTLEKSYYEIYLNTKLH